MSKIENLTSSLVRVPFNYGTHIYTDFSSVKSPYPIDSIFIAPKGSQPTNETLYFADGIRINKHYKKDGITYIDVYYCQSPFYPNNEEDGIKLAKELYEWISKAPLPPNQILLPFSVFKVRADMAPVTTI